MSKIKVIKQIVVLYVFIFLAWGLYRYLFRLPSEIEELILKPLVWLIPVFLILKREKKGFGSIGWSSKNLFKSLYLGIGLGIIFAFEGLLANNLKYGQLNLVDSSLISSNAFIVSLFISFVTAISEETVFRGFIFTRLWEITKNEWFANIVSSVGWTLIHFPITVFVFHYSLEQMIIYWILTFIFGFASCLVYGRTQTILAPILLHVFWSWPINLFR